MDYTAQTYTVGTLTAPRKPRYSPSIIRNRDHNVTLMKAAAICRAELYRTEMTVYLLNGKDKVLSLRPEHCDHSFKEHPQVVQYRANVFNTVTKQVRFVDLVPGQMLKVM